MNWILILLVTTVILIDFFSLHKHNKRTVYVYIGIVFLIILVSVVAKFELLETGPLEFLIEVMEPVVNWVSDKLGEL